MNRLRMATWAALVGLGVLSGCQSSRNGCGDNGGGLFRREGSLMSRLGLRHHNGNGGVVLPGPAVGAPVSALPLTGHGCTGPISEGPILEGHPGGTTFPGDAPVTPAPGVLPHPTPLGAVAPPLAPVPNSTPLAPEAPAPPSAMSRRRQ